MIHFRLFNALKVFLLKLSFLHYFMWIIRNGEWGDHVTLQAAADAVFATNLLFTCYFASFSANCILKLY